MKIIVNLALCDGNGNCAQEAPEYFSLDESDTVHVLKIEVSEGDREKVAAAIRACPKSAISIVE